ncbi:MAG: relaxase/mobilization nuclease domain-containing protein [Lachnospiraceae bacterium]|nr:relaxase/mobilization nuclease domain-containing protein [Lachnospiraceae bacterium]
MSIEKDIAIHATDGVRNVLDYVTDKEHNGQKANPSLYYLTHYRDVDNVLAYAQNLEKTVFNLDGDETLLVSGVGCSPSTAAIAFQLDRDRYYRESRMAARPTPIHINPVTGEAKSKNAIECYHVIQSFPAMDDLDPRVVHEIGVEYAKRAFAGHKCVVTTHMNTEHLHNHIVVCAYSEIEPVKFHMNKATRRQIRYINDRLSVEYELPIILNPRKTPTHSRTYTENIGEKRQHPVRPFRPKSLADALHIDYFTSSGRMRSELEIIFLKAIRLILYFLDRFFDPEGARQHPKDPIYKPYQRRVEQMERAIFTLRDLGIETEWDLKVRLKETGAKLSHAKTELKSVEASLSYMENLSDLIWNALGYREEAASYSFSMEDLKLHTYSEEQVFAVIAEEQPMTPEMKRSLYRKLEQHPEWKLRYGFDTISYSQAKDIYDYLNGRAVEQPVHLVSAEEHLRKRMAKRDATITRKKQGIKDSDAIDRNSQQDKEFDVFLYSGNRSDKEIAAIAGYRDVLNGLLEHGLDLEKREEFFSKLEAIEVVKEMLQAQVSDLSKDYKMMKRLESDLQLAKTPQFTRGPLFTEAELTQYVTHTPKPKPVQKHEPEPLPQPKPESAPRPIPLPEPEPVPKKKTVRNDPSLDDDYLSL